jgi:rfaE bifunctional protein nucleotidyltransferase chain/domain
MNRTRLNWCVFGSVVDETGHRRIAMTLDLAVALVDRSRAAGQRIVFTNGVFDLLHAGHVRYLQQARSLGDVLIVGLNSDRSVRANKGPGRPITPEAERAEILEALTPVDAVVVFDAETPYDLIEALEPDVLVKGADWAEDAIVGRDLVEQRGGRVVRVPLEPGRSTSAIIRKVTSGSGPPDDHPTAGHAKDSSCPRPPR